MWRRRAESRQSPPDGLRLPGSAPAPAARVGVRPAIVVPKRGRLGEDILLGLFGVALGLGSAFFPWYVFFNQEKFGIEAVKFDSESQGPVGLSTSTPQLVRIDDPRELKDVTTLQLDTVSTGTTPPADAEPLPAPTVSEQPFPHRDAGFRIVHIENGRAMIEDGSGLWIVQQGSMLPDMSRVRSIEQRDGEWVVVTSADQVIPVAR